VAFALCLVGPDKNSVINLRKGAFAAKSQIREFSWATLRRPVLAVGAVTFCIAVSLAVQTYSYDAQLTATNQRLQRSVQMFFGQLSPSAVRTYMADTARLRARVDSELKKQREQAQLLGANPRSPLNFLKSISESIPRDLTVDLMKFQEGASPSDSFSQMDASTSASMTFYLLKPETADQLAGTLSGELNGLKKSGAEAVTLPDGSKRWKIEFSGRPTEEAYAK